MTRLALLNIPEWTPRKLGNLKLWLDATRITGLNDGDAVTTWSDVSGNGNDATQSVLASKPIYKVNIRNGKPVVRFNGSQYLLTAANSVLRNATGATALIVLQTTAPGTQANSLFIANNSAPARLTMLRERTGAGVLEVGGRRLDADSYAAINGASFTAGVWSVDTGILDYANSNAYLYTNGGLVAQTTSFQTDGNTSDTDSAGTAIGATITGATAMNGDITEILVYSVALSDASRRRLENYVGKKYGITITW